MLTLSGWLHQPWSHFAASIVSKLIFLFIHLFQVATQTIFHIKIFDQIGIFFFQDEDAFDMRKALSKDVNKMSVVPLDRDVHIDELEY